MSLNEYKAPERLIKQQFAFASHIRNENSVASVDGVSKERLNVYRELFFNNFKDALGSAFPVTRDALDEASWLSLCEDFLNEYRCQSPYLSGLPEEFLDFLRQDGKQVTPWLTELAYWEWIELDLFLSDDECFSTEPADVLMDKPRLSTLVRLASFQYPVHTIAEGQLPDRPLDEPVHLLAWRKPDDSIGFMQLNTMSAYLLEQLNTQDKTGEELLQVMSDTFTGFEPQVIFQGGADILQSFYHKGIILKV